ncbi:TNT domain-containing protein, partial [Bacillus swezeyi]
EGRLIDRYGGPGGSFFSPEGIPYEQRALALHSDEADYYVYRVLEDFEVTGGKIAPWFDRPGGGIQYIKYHDNGKTYSIEELVQEELIELVSVKKGV